MDTLREELAARGLTDWSSAKTFIDRAGIQWDSALTTECTWLLARIEADVLLEDFLALLDEYFMSYDVFSFLDSPEEFPALVEVVGSGQSVWQQSITGVVVTNKELDGTWQHVIIKNIVLRPGVGVLTDRYIALDNLGWKSHLQNGFVDLVNTYSDWSEGKSSLYQFGVLSAKCCSTDPVATKSSDLEAEELPPVSEPDPSVAALETANLEPQESKTVAPKKVQTKAVASAPVAKKDSSWWWLIILLALASMNKEEKKVQA